jgi:HK97 gp10 family phage protein
MAGFSLKGLKAVQAQLESVAAETRVKLLRSAMREAFKPVLEEAKARVPRDSGALAEGLVIGSAKVSGEAIAVGIVVVNNSARAKQANTAAAAFGEAQSMGVPPSRRWHFIEMGTAKRAARPFLRPALISGAAGVVEALQQAVSKRIRKALKK